MLTDSFRLMGFGRKLSARSFAQQNRALAAAARAARALIKERARRISCSLEHCPPRRKSRKVLMSRKTPSLAAALHARPDGARPCGPARTLRRRRTHPQFDQLTSLLARDAAQQIRDKG